MRKHFYFLFFWLLCSIVQINAQVTIGSGKVPASYSILELETTEREGGLRLPHLTTEQRDALPLTARTASDPSNEDGLTIYNITSQCVEYWDTREWISLCVSSASFTFDNGNEGPIPGEGGSSEPVKPEGGGCNLNPPYNVQIVAGFEYVANTDIVTDIQTGEFVVEFLPNPQAYPRYVVVRVTDNCTNLYRDVSLMQDGDTSLCEANPVIPIINSHVDALCNQAQVPLWLTNAPDDQTYIWTRDGREIEGVVGTSMIADRPGVYGVVVGAMGCPNSTSATKTLTKTDGSAAPAPVITATNGGVVCGSNTVELVSSTSVDWYKDNVYVSTGTSVVVSDAAGAGVYYALVEGSCGSQISNQIIVSFDDTSSNDLEPLKASVNGVSITADFEVCIGGSMDLTIDNPEDYEGLSYRFVWYLNDIIAYEGTDSKVIVDVPEGDSVAFEVRLITIGSCPLSLSNTATAKTVDLSTPEINNTYPLGFLCGTDNLDLKVTNLEDTSNTTFEWYRNGQFLNNTTQESILSISQTGSYKVRYNKDGCWSKFSEDIEVKSQAKITMFWEGGAPTDEVIGTEKTIAVVSLPEANEYAWTSSDPASVKVTALEGDSRYATIEYLEVSDEPATIIVHAKNDCSEKELSVAVSAVLGCSPVTNLRFLNPSNYAETGKTSTYEVSATGGGSDTVEYEWKLFDITTGTDQEITLEANAASTLDYIFTTKGKYRLEAYAFVACQMIIEPGQPQPTKAKVTLNIDVSPSKEEVDGYPNAPGAYNVDGKWCFDVVKTGSTSGRVHDFRESNNTTEKYTWNYVLKGTPISDVAAYVYGSNANFLLSKNPTVSGTTITLEYNKANTEAVSVAGRQFELIVVFKGSGGVTYKIVNEISVQDKPCCPGYLAKGAGYDMGNDINLGKLPHSTSSFPADVVDKNYYTKAMANGKDICFYKKSNATLRSTLAAAGCKDATLADGFSGAKWRLPSIGELRHLDKIGVSYRLSSQATSAPGTQNLTADYWVGTRPSVGTSFEALAYSYKSNYASSPLRINSVGQTLPTRCVKEMQ